MGRLLDHLIYPEWRLRRVFPASARNAIEEAVRASERSHSGELRFVAEGGLGLSCLRHGRSANERALEVFSHLRMWDTDERSGVLIYLQLAERRVEIVADRGIHAKVGDAVWQRICSGMEEAFRAGRFEEGAVQGILAIGRVLSTHFPAGRRNPDELPNRPIIGDVHEHRKD